MKIVRTRRGARIVDGRDVLSEILARPGATGTLFDVLAACVAGLAPGPRVALLGFAGGGVVAPLRAMGFGHPLQAVDLSCEGETLFRELSDSWCGNVRVSCAEASEWLRNQRQPYDLILEDLSLPSEAGGGKPPVSVDVLPHLMHQRIAPHGVVVTNVLPAPELGWTRLLERLAGSHASAVVVSLDHYENRILVSSERLQARDVSRRIRTALSSIRSPQVKRLGVRTMR